MRLALVLLFVAACGKHASRAQVEAACEHEIELGFWSGFEDSIKKGGHDANDPELHAMAVKALAEQQQSDGWKAQLKTCTDGSVDQMTPAQYECIVAAKTVQAGIACATK
ncbi:MAG TPA: hypothetical protein VL463_28480 [Kofleriaceae bacterium]|jgi:hypothetical protein|nr:hypothetical protein [Kofleriaceae bacterium]